MFDPSFAHSIKLHLLGSPEVDHLVEVVDAEEEYGGLVEGAHGVDAVPQPVLDHVRQLMHGKMKLIHKILLILISVLT